MPESLPSLELVADEVRAQRVELIRHLEALDAKAGIVLGSAGLVAALAAQHLSAARAFGTAAAVLAALRALAALTVQRFAAWDVFDLRRHVDADVQFTRTAMLDTTIVMVRDLKLAADQKLIRTRAAARLVGLAIFATAIGTIVD